MVAGRAMLHPPALRHEALLCVQAQRKAEKSVQRMSEGLANDQCREGADPTSAEGLPLAPLGQAAPGPFEQASGPPFNKADAAHPDLTGKAPDSPTRKAPAFPTKKVPASPTKKAPACPTKKAPASPTKKVPASPTKKVPASPPKGAPASPFDSTDASLPKQSSGGPSEEADASSSEKASVFAPLENADLPSASPHGHPGFSPSSSPKTSKSSAPPKPAKSTPSVESSTKSVDSTSSCKRGATTDAQLATELGSKVSGLNKRDTLNGGEKEDDSWRLPAHHTPSSSGLSSSSDITSTDEHRAAASDDAQVETETAAGHSAGSMEAEAAAGESPLQLVQKVSEAANGSHSLQLSKKGEEAAASNNPQQPTKREGQAAAGRSVQQPIQEVAAAADESPLQTVQKLLSSTSAPSPATSCRAGNSTKHSTGAAAAISAGVGAGKSGGLNAAADSFVPRSFQPTQQDRTLTRPRLPQDLLKDNNYQAKALKILEALSASTYSSSANGCSLSKPPPAITSTGAVEAAHGSSPSSATEAPGSGPMQKVTPATEFRGMKPTLFKKSPPQEQDIPSWQSFRANDQFPPPHTGSSAMSSPLSPTSVLRWGSLDIQMPLAEGPSMEEVTPGSSAMSSPRSPTSVLRWGSLDIYTPPAKGPSMDQVTPGPFTIGPAVHRPLNLPNITSPLQGKHCLLCCCKLSLDLVHMVGMSGQMLSIVTTCHCTVTKRQLQSWF